MTTLKAIWQGVKDLRDGMEAMSNHKMGNLNSESRCPWISTSTVLLFAPSLRPISDGCVPLALAAQFEDFNFREIFIPVHRYQHDCEAGESIPAKTAYTDKKHRLKFVYQKPKRLCSSRPIVSADYMRSQAPRQILRLFSYHRHIRSTSKSVFRRIVNTCMLLLREGYDLSAELRGTGLCIHFTQWEQKNPGMRYQPRYSNADDVPVPLWLSCTMHSKLSQRVANATLSEFPSAGVASNVRVHGDVNPLRLLTLRRRTSTQHSFQNPDRIAIVAISRVTCGGVQAQDLKRPDIAR
ncbi:hypothetical protein IW261DRAFT_1412829 [Armillaria novae-zelandiae]|uniref:Uncharacterized protein n=1 Tax=Armillaria novae-zelandiae TaxID=153914 RepID=A0AA39UJG6_9AGAR|nr:hypothetical protein IW261DRAFT_1412829 [Armillaria novae-zelandiae]